jgi:hypothetical protein
LPRLWSFDERTDAHVAEVREMRSGEDHSES